MQTYEFSAKVTSDGKLELPEIYLKDLPSDSVIKVVVVIDATEKADVGFSAESFRQSWHEAQTGQTLPLSQLWEGIEVE